MKNIFIILILLLNSCTQYEYIGQEIIDGKVSHTEEGRLGGLYSRAYLPKIWVQNNIKTVEVKIPFIYQDRWQVGDSCLLIIEKYKEIKEK